MSANFYPVILAGGRGTRFWPLSRKKRAKQLLALDGKQTMIQQTVARLLPLAPAKQIWVITNETPALRFCVNFQNLKKTKWSPSLSAATLPRPSDSLLSSCSARIPMR